MNAVQSPHPVVIDSIELAPGPTLEVRGVGGAPNFVELIGARLRLRGTVSSDPEGSWHAAVPLLASRWGGAEMPAPSGRYRIAIDGVPVAPTDAETATRRNLRLPESQLVPGYFRIAFQSEKDGIVVAIAAPLRDDERGSANQAKLETQYRTARSPLRDAVFFESFYGQNASCNPLALDRVIASVRPDITRYWGVVDASVAVPLGSIPVIEGSAQWWEVRGSVRLIVINDWLRNRYRKKPHQKVLQTWHGTMLKKLALSRKRPGLRTALATLRERSRWDILLSQNDYATGVFRRAYAYFGAIWNEGYPRDDLLASGAESDAATADIRRRLDIPDGVRVVLYAPTWRDDHPDHVDHLDVAQFTEKLGEGYVTLIRGHSRTLQPGEDLHAGGVIDVTSYPDVSDLFLVADALVTDYSSVMFDFSVTGKPIYFFTPDFDRYRQVLRGFYFDLLPVAPGPVVQSPDELVALVRDPDAVRADYAEKYAAWRERFNPYDDGHAAERIVARLIREGVL